MTEETAITAGPAGDVEAPELDIVMIEHLHQDKDGFIAFTRKPDPTAPPRLDRHGKPYQFDNLFSMRPGELREMLPEIARHLMRDSYMSVNTFYRQAHFKSSITGLPGVERKEKSARGLMACYVDIDCGRPESEEPGAALDWRQAQHKAERLADAGIIPQPSVIARSGRGVYLYWILYDPHNPDGYQKAWPEKIVLYKACNKTLGERLRTHELPADKVAFDAARVLRVPGSIHTKAGRRVTYVLQLDQNRNGFSYTLGEMAAALGLTSTGGELPAAVRELAKPPAYRRTKKPGSAPARSAGRVKLNAMRAQDLRTIEEWRGGFLKRGAKYPDGSISPGRRFILGLYAGFLRLAKTARAEAEDKLRDMAANMKPAYPSDPDDLTVENIVSAIYQGKPTYYKNENEEIPQRGLCRILGITSAAARELDLLTIKPNELAVSEDKARPTLPELVAARRQFAAEYVRTHPRVSARGLAAVYRERGFIGANHQTANQDLNAIGHKMRGGQAKGGRPRRAI